MPRKPRQHIIGDAHHVMAHGIDHLKLFRDNEDCQVFLQILDNYMTQLDCHCYCYALEDNHYHLVLRPSGDKTSFSRLMRNTNSMYARYYNKKYKRRGYLFWGRPQTIPSRDLDYLKQLVVYVHRNPIRSGKVTSMQELHGYNRSSHQYLCGKTSPYSWLKIDYSHALLMIGIKDKENYFQEYLKAIGKEHLTDFDPWKEPGNRANPIPAAPAASCRSESQWIRGMVQKWDRFIKQRKKLQKTPNILELLADTCTKHFNLAQRVTDFHSDHMTYRSARNLFAYWAITLAGYSGVLIGRMLGINQSTALRAAARGKSIAMGIPLPV